MSEGCCGAKGRELERLSQHAAQRRVLVAVLVINAVMFAVEFIAGVVAGSAALMADSIDMLGDALVYALSLYALDRSETWKGAAALAKGGFILVFGIGVLVEIAVKVTSGVPPQSQVMMVFAALALVANLACLRLLWRFRAVDVNMTSTFECSRNDVIANCGVLVAAGTVAITGSPWPDIAVAAVIAAVFLRSAMRIIASAVPILRAT